jgi:hypothetical protein
LLFFLIGSGTGMPFSIFGSVFVLLMFSSTALFS